MSLALEGAASTSASDTPKYAVVVAGGSGLRMGGHMPKQFMPLNGRPILMYTLERLYESAEGLHIILVLPRAHEEHWQNLVAGLHFAVPHQITPGGATRTESVRNGLSLVPDEALVAIHDGVRPFVSTRTVREAFDTAAKEGCAVAAVPSKDSIRQVEATGRTHNLERSALYLVQTPQTFQARLIKQAYEQLGNQHLTDDATVLEMAGHPIPLVEGSYQNIKITTPDDMVLAEAIYQLQRKV